MNFLEFISDEYVSLKAQHFFNGFIFNKIPLLKKLKWREVVTVKALYGNLTADNDPKLNPSLFKFPTDEDGNPTSFGFDNATPYVEFSAGVTNVFKILRIELLQRVTYLNNPNVTSLFGVKGLGIRAKGKIDF